MKQMSNLFTRRHYEWMVDMCIELNLTQDQIQQLSKMLERTNPAYDGYKFRTTITYRRNKTSGGI
tara:strand:- start:464 stop:658 length:195 start_codon:yes stop_codon:yes gene_type:complete